MHAKEKWFFFLPDGVDVMRHLQLSTTLMTTATTPQTHIARKCQVKECIDLWKRK